jgi:hypothetical protein
MRRLMYFFRERSQGPDKCDFKDEDSDKHWDLSPLANPMRSDNNCSFATDRK